jgi:glutamate formiminotransferase
VPLIECVPNVSEGRRDAVITAIEAAVDGPGVRLLDRSSDPSHNRTVYTFAGEAEPVREAVLRLFAAALASIDLRQHEGVHPRIGAVDVVPSYRCTTSPWMTAWRSARRTAAAVAARYGVPVFLYERRPRPTSAGRSRRSGEAA